VRVVCQLGTGEHIGLLTAVGAIDFLKQCHNNLPLSFNSAGLSLPF
jgi:hypothetical protein